MGLRYCVLVAFVMATLAGPGLAVTPKQAVLITHALTAVTDAVRFLEENGKVKALAEFNSPKSRFNYIECYIFAYDVNGVVIAEPRNRSLFGMNLLNLTDSDGKLYIKELVSLAKTRGRGSLDFNYENSDTGGVDARRLYFERVDDVIICCMIPKPED